MSLKLLAVAPLVVLLVIIFVEYGSVAAATGQTICVPNANSGPCTSAQTTITCSLPSGQICNNVKATWLSLVPFNGQNGDLIGRINSLCTATHQILGDGAPPPPASCGQDVFGIWNGQILLISGQSITVATAQSTSNVISTSGPLTLFYSATGPTVYGYVAMVIVALGVVLLASISAFGGSFTSLESAHILFVAGLTISMFIILSLVEGFVTGNPNSMFTQLNNQKVGGVSSGLGTGAYGIISFVEAIGIVFLVSRGE